MGGGGCYSALVSDSKLLSPEVFLLKTPLHSPTQSCDQISCCVRPMERTNKISLELISLVPSSSFP